MSVANMVGASSPPHPCAQVGIHLTLSSRADERLTLRLG